MKRFTHSSGHEVLTTFNQGQYVPIMCFDAIPNETLRLRSELLIRTQPLLAPIYAKCKATISYYGVPTRIIWKDFDQFRTGGASGDSTVEAPYIMSPPVTGWAVGSLADYLGFPTGVPDLKCSALPFRAYARIWNDYVRDKDLMPELVVSTGNGLDTTTSTVLKNVCWAKDTRNTARPYPQKGAAVSIPLTGNAPVRGLGFAQPLGSVPGASGTTYESGDTGATSVTYPTSVLGSNTNQMNLLRVKMASASTTQPHRLS